MRADERVSPPRTIVAWVVPLVVILAWDAHQMPRLAGPLSSKPEQWASRQIGGTGLRHLTLGLRRTGGANVRDVKQDGSLTLHTSYPPLASWTVAAFLALGLPFNVAIRLPALVSMNLFFIGQWVLARALWGERAAGFAVAYAAFCPLILFRYGLMYVFESLALGPVMLAAGLLASPARGTLARLAIVTLAVISALYCWIAWIVLLPCAAREVLLGRKRFGFMLAAISVIIPAGLHLATIALAIGTFQGLLDEIGGFLHHVLVRSSSVADTGEQVTYKMMGRELTLRCSYLVGYVPTVSALILLARLAVGWDRARSGFWIALLFAFGLPLSFVALNIAFHHDFLLVTLIPALTLSAAWVSVGPFEDLNDPPWKGLAAGLIVFLGFAYVDVWRNRWLDDVTAEDIRSEQIFELIGRTIRQEDFVIVNPPVANITKLPGDRREVRSMPYYFGKTVQAVFVATDQADAARIATQARPGQRVVIVEADDQLFELPAGFRPLPHSIEELIIGVKEPPGPDQSGLPPASDR
jgi:hypothetical protein